ncbi:MAG: ABC transporter substrate-binding protein [Chloroflexi bacterium]|nr:ABC transporter substrate-binding protein [Chloroflexota bacterium]
MRLLQTGFVAGALGLLLVMVAGCGPAAQPAASPEGQPSAQAPQIKRGGAIRYAQNGDPPTFDVHASSLGILTNQTRATHSRLTRYDYGKERGSLLVVPDLAERWEVSPDAKTWTFYLRKGVKFHNVAPANGRELVAEDIKYSFDRIRGPAPSIWTGQYSFIESIEVADKYTVRFQLKQPSASALYRFTDGEAAWIVGRDVLEGLAANYGKTHKSLVGTGPFMADAYDRGVALKYKRNPDFFGSGVSGTPYVDEVEVLIINDAAARLAAFLSKQIDYFSVPLADLERVKSSVPGGQIIENKGTNTLSGVVVNVSKPPFDNVKVRQALKHGVNQQRIIDDLFKGAGSWNGFMPGGLSSWAMPQEEVKQLYRHDPEKAKQLLAEAGYSGGFKGDLLVFSQYSQVYIDVAEFLVADLKKVGIDLAVKLEPVAAGRKAVEEGNFALNNSAQITGLEPDEFVKDGLVPGGSRNFGRLNDSKINDLAARQSVLVDAKERRKIVDEIARQVAEVVPFVPIPNQWSYNAAQPYVKNYFPDNVATDEPIETFIWLDK